LISQIQSHSASVFFCSEVKFENFIHYLFFYSSGIIFDYEIIKKEIMDKIFELNFTTKENGSGVGLYLANQIAIKHTGILYAKNSQNGARFIFKIRKKG